MNRFGTLINCIDGRTQLPLIQWLKEKYYLDYVDDITEPGPEKAMTKGNEAQIQSIKARVLISINVHGSNVVAISAHHDCAGNRASREEQWNQVRKSIEIMRFWNLPVSFAGLWVNETFSVEVVE